MIKIYFLKEIQQDEWRSKNHKMVCTTRNYIEHFVNIASTITGCISISSFASLSRIPIEITNSAIGLQICAVNAGIEKYKSIIKKKKKKLDEIILLAKYKLNSIEVLISKALFDSNVSHEKFVPINNVLREYDEMKEEVKNLKT